MKRILVFIVVSLLFSVSYAQSTFSVVKESFTRPDTVTFQAIPSAISVAWEFPGGNVNTLNNLSDFGVTVIYKTPGKYSVHLTIDTGGTKTIDSVYKNIVFAPGIINKDTVLCVPDTIKLVATGGSNYYWNMSTYSDSLYVEYPPQSQYYFIKISKDADNVITMLDSVSVSFASNPGFSQYNPSYCLGTATPIIIPDNIKSYTLTTMVGDTVKGPFTNVNPYYFKQSEMFTIAYTDTSGCKWKSSEFVVGNNSITAPVVSLQDQTICSGTQATFDLSTYEYPVEWYKLHNDTMLVSSAQFQTSDSGSYIAKVFDYSYTCYSSNTVNVWFYPSTPEPVTSINNLPGIGNIITFVKSPDALKDVLYNNKGIIAIDSTIDNTMYRKLPVIIDTTSYSVTPIYYTTSINTCNYENSSKIVSPVQLKVQYDFNVGANNLSWSKYTVKNVSSYYIFRGTKPEDMKLLTTVNSSVLDYTDTGADSLHIYAIGVKDDSNADNYYKDMLLTWQAGYITSNISPAPLHYKRIGVFAFLQSDQAGSTVYLQAVAPLADSVSWELQDNVIDGVGTTTIDLTGEKVNHRYTSDGRFDVKVKTYTKSVVDSVILPQYISIGNPLYSNLDTIYKNIGTDTLKIDIAATIKNAVNFLSSQKVFWSISAAENNDMFVHQVSNLSNASDSLLLWVNPTLSETKFTFDLSLDYLDLYFKNQTITVVVTGKPNQKPLILDSIPEQIATIGKTFEPLYLPDYIKDDYTQFENLKIKADTNAYFNLTVKDGYLTATQTDGMFTGTTQTVLKVVDEAGLETDFGIQYTQPYLVNVPLKNVNPSASFYVSKVFVRPDDQVRFYTVLASTDSVFWDFSGGNQVSGTTVNPEVMFQKPGLYTITLTAKNENGVVSVLKNNYIVVSAMSPQDTTICKGDSVTITAIGAGFNAYAWNNDIFQPNPSIKVAPMQTTTYIVKMKKSLSIIIDSVIIHVATQPELGKDSSFCDGNTVRLNPGLFKSYYWNGLNTEGQSSYFDVTTGGKVTVKTIDSKGCVSSDSINLIVNPKPIVNLGKDSTFCWKDTITLNAGNTGSSFVWNTGKTTQTIIADTTKSYSVTVTNASKCSTSDTVQINVIVPIVPQIGVVTQSESGMNLIAWEPQFDKGIKLYHVWLESSTTGVFTLINTNAIDSLTYAIDLNSDPQTQSFNYALTSVDAACGNESYRSKIHSSIHLKCVLLDAKTVTATWNSYSGIAVTQYIIYRAKKGETIMPYDTINVDPGKSEIIYTDTNAIGLNSMYRVEFNLPNKVSPSKLKSDSGPFSQSLSNMAESQLVGIDITSLDASVKAYPNPANGIVYVSIQGNTPNEYEIELTDAIGRRLFQANTGKITDKTVLIESSSFASGMYMLKVISSNGIISKKIVITR